jgi:uncharacterized protein (TIGR02145 family)
MKIILNLTVLIIIVLTTSACGDKTPPKIVKEPITPDVMVIGTQTWTAKNLNVATFRNGDPIPEAKSPKEWKAASDNKQAAWCYYENDPKNGTKYGKLYNWYAVNDSRGLAKAGWHIPTDEEWTVLFDFLGGNDAAGKKMKRNSGWLANGNGTNSSGFSGLPGGYCSYDAKFLSVGYDGFWWSSSKVDESYAWSRRLNCNFSSRNRFKYLFNFGFSVRLVKA